MLVTESNFSEIKAQLAAQYGEIEGFEADLNGEKVYGFMRKPSRQELFGFMDNVTERPMTAMAFMFDIIALRDYTHPIFFSDDSYYAGAVPAASKFVNIQKVALKKN